MANLMKKAMEFIGWSDEEENLDFDSSDCTCGTSCSGGRQFLYA